MTKQKLIEDFVESLRIDCENWMTMLCEDCCEEHGCELRRILRFIKELN